VLFRVRNGPLSARRSDLRQTTGLTRNEHDGKKEQVSQGQTEQARRGVEVGLGSPTYDVTFSGTFNFLFQEFAKYASSLSNDPVQP
jgi:hypothetical protein